MTNKEISKALKLTAALGELHGENPFKLKSLTNASFQIDRISDVLMGKSLEELQAIPGIGKSIAEKINELLNEGITEELLHYKSITPVGVVAMLGVKGLGPKKVSLLWHEMGIESPGELLYACNENRLVSLKGFGEKTQESIRKNLEFKSANAGHLLFAEAEMVALEIIKYVKDLQARWRIEMTSQLRRKMEVVEMIELISDVDATALQDVLEQSNDFTLTHIDEDFESVLTYTYKEQYKFTVLCSGEDSFEKNQLLLTGPPEHLDSLDFDPEEEVVSEEALYSERGFPYIIPELRDLDIEKAAAIDVSKLVNLGDIKGVIHNHSTWSDGANTLEEMALAAKNLGLEYLIICDHSRSAGYAGGLSIERVYAQWKEIDAINEKLAPFYVFKGIESDILTDGSLDYPNDVLKDFDLVVASVHSVLNMDENKANNRLLKAIENPYTKMLGHPTGRLLLSRPEYPINHKHIIDACFANHVIMELNANPFRLDIDWRWIPYCMEKGVKVSINPDAHRIEGYGDMRYGIEVARKGGLYKDFLFNSASLDEMKEILKK
ncbi:MAG: helix-hairpin-helix domain-containing protein [Bacteroidia bacterium]